MNKKNIAKLVPLVLTICILIVVSLYTNKAVKSKKDLASLKETAAVAVVEPELDIPLGQDYNLKLDKRFLNYNPRLGKTFTGFKEQLGFKESQNNYFRVNTLGYLGKYQFGRSTLQMIGINDTKHFLSNPELQEKAFIANTERNKWVLRRDIKRYSGRYIGGVKITESGILAAAHLAGPGSVKKYLRSQGADCFEDAYGTTIKSYLKRFSGFDTSEIKPNKKARVSLKA
ncbi:peptidoglycan-binding protein LysM [Lacinutrix sp. MedPE-SW]|uniref:peptidoglycan-binding protein LysM n=1 Tax=Lacinutrix sp. MedPE-SW TaxID=1860087 RepID=UPI000911C359|nr:peptidoglycan-binding protein LysM [Lacinutrix sp. MedPE-SW]OIQ16320.1 MAG: peptidoglycan-binding protein LysM [Lacinutrix sp. MedPE-SW]